MHWYQMKLLGRAQTHSSDSQVCRPDTVADVSKYMEQVGKSGIIARGSGSVYADQALNSGGAVMMSELLESLRSKPVPVPIRIGTKDYRAKSTCKQLHPLDVKAITAKLAFTKE